MSDTILPTLKIETPILFNASLPFIQRLSLVLGERVVGSATWFTPATVDGVVQILDIQVEADHQRRGHGSVLLRGVYEQAQTLFKIHDIKPRRCWVAVEQKAHVNARAFLSRHGYHHVSSIKNVYRKQESLIYMRAFD